MLYRQLLAPTGVDHALFAKLTGSPHPNLVVSRSSGLDVYDIVGRDQGSMVDKESGGGGGGGSGGAGGPLGGGGGSSGDGGGAAGGPVESLELVASIELPGNIQSMQRARFESGCARQVLGGREGCDDDGLDVLLLSFSDAKVSMVAKHHETARPQLGR